VLDRIIAESVRIKAEVVSADEKEGDLRRILNFGHTLGHALEAETRYERFLHGEAVAFGMNAATQLASLVGLLDTPTRDSILRTVSMYGPIPSLDGIPANALFRRLVSDKINHSGQSAFRAARSNRQGASHVRCRRGKSYLCHRGSARMSGASPRGAAPSRKPPPGYETCSAA
jgi:3-dehydroquinate synthetase